MKLTGKCKEDFEKWYDISDIEGTPESVEWFDFYHSSMQYGVYVDFFDSVGFYIGRDEVENWWLQVDNEDFFDADEYNYLIFETIFNREQAILKANEIYNSKTEK